ncbi:MAG TPA: hypothetical protein VMU67_00810 [Steroidobacteraceae bacterium]|nr:hypothetical protein [Steroidobacteraceae bacterium]
MSRTYPPSSYDDFMCLKPPLLLWIAALYLSRAVSLPIVLGFTSLVGGSSGDIRAFVGGFIGAESLLPSLIAFAVLCGLVRRAPTGSRAIRWVWARGQWLLALSAGVDFAFRATDVSVRLAGASDQTVPALLAAAMDLYFLAYVLAARRAHDAFAEFPAATDVVSR